MHCPGVKVSAGRTVDWEMLKGMLNEIEKRDPLFLERKRTRETGAITQEYFDLKHLLYMKIGQRIFCDALRGQNITTKGESLAHAFLRVLENKESGNLLVQVSHLDETLPEFERRLMVQIPRSLRFISARQRKEIKKATKEKTAKMTIDKIERIVALNEEVDFFDLFGKSFKVKPCDLLKDKKTSRVAEKLFQEHIQEVLRRYGAGGAPIDISLVEVVESLRRYCEILDTYSRVYSCKENEIGEKAVLLAIGNLDTKMVFTEFCDWVHNSLKDELDSSLN
jgi:hypothetical protein